MILDGLFNPDLIAQGKPDKLELVIPSIDTEDHNPVLEISESDLDGCTYILHGTPSALRHACYLLALLADISSSAATSYDATPAFHSHLAWIFDSYLLLWEVERTWRSCSATQESGVESCAWSLRAIRSMLSSLEGLLPVTLKRKGFRVLAHLCVELVDYGGALSELSVQKTFCTSILDLAAICGHDNAVSQAVGSPLLPALQNLTSADLPITLSMDVMVCCLVPSRLNLLYYPNY